MFRDNISSSPLEYQSLSSYIFLAYNIHIFIHESPKNLKRNAFWHNLRSVPQNLHLSLFLGYIPSIDIPPYVFTNSVGLAEISFQ